MRKISVVTVCYNSEKNIERCIKSIINQLNDDIEYLLIDGKSTDKTVSIIKKYEKNNPNIRYISEKDNGIYDAMNKGIKYSNGEWIIYINSDDYLVKDSLKKVMPYLENNFDCVYGNNYQLYEHNNEYFYKILEADNDLDKLNIGMIACHQSILMRRKKMQELGGFNTNYKIAADWDMMLRMKNSNCLFKKINFPISVFSVGGISSTQKYSMEHHMIRKNNNCYKIFDINLIRDIIHGIHVKRFILKLIYKDNYFYTWLNHNGYIKMEVLDESIVDC